ncbi:unnamed protein product [Lepidochelys kempii]
MAALCRNLQCNDWKKQRASHPSAGCCTTSSWDSLFYTLASSSCQKKTQKQKPTLPHILKQVLNEAVCTVNFIKSSSTSVCLFGVLCDEIGAECHQLLYHTEVWRLSRGKVLNHSFEPRVEVRIFLSHKDSPLAEKFAVIKGLALQAYLAAIPCGMLVWTVAVLKLFFTS